MGKKKVPDWLNSSLWSTTPSSSSDSDHRLPYSAKLSTSPAAGTPVHPPVPAPPPVAVREEPPTTTKPEIRTKEKDSTVSVSSNNSNSDSKEDNGCSVTSPSAEDISRQAQVLTELSRKVINMRELRRIASQGIPDGSGIRSTVWKLLLGYLPPDRSMWAPELAKKRSQYKQFKEDLLMNPSEITRRLEKSTLREKDDLDFKNRGMLSRSEIPHGEHPLSLGKTSIWNQFFQDAEIMEQIDRDVNRTHPDMHFFSGDSAFAKSNRDALRNILNVFAKLNPGIRYVQGMNEILAPIFYVFRNDPDEEMAFSLTVKFHEEECVTCSRKGKSKEERSTILEASRGFIS